MKYLQSQEEIVMQDSKISERRERGEALLKKYYGANYPKYKAMSESAKKVHHLIKGLVGQSARNAKLSLTEEELIELVKEIEEQAAAAAERVRRDYVYTRTRHKGRDKFGAVMINTWLADKAAKLLEQEEEQKS